LTEKPNTQLFDAPRRLFAALTRGQARKSQVRLAAAVCLPLIFFFIFALSIDRRFFIFIIASLLLIIPYLIFFQYHFLQNKAATDLQIQDIREEINLVDAQIFEEKKKIDAFRKKITDFLQLKNLTERLSLSLSLEETSKTLSTEVNKVFGSEDTTIILYLFHSATGELGISASQKGQMSINLKTKKGDIFDQWVARNMQTLWIEDTRADYRFDMDKIKIEDDRVIRSLMSVPLMSGTKTLGILRVDSPKERQFDTDDLRFLTTIGDLASVAVENAQLHEKVGQLAIKDSLTGLYLRRYLLERMPEEISRELRRQKPLSFLMIDIDRFKEYNDKFGHMAGDIVLRTIGFILADFFKEPGNLVCRYGGEEFSVLLPECSKDKALGLAQKVREYIESQAILLRREKTYVTVSIGVAAFPKDAQLKDELIDKADQALYRAKQEGRNRVCTF